MALRLTGLTLLLLLSTLQYNFCLAAVPHRVHYKEFYPQLRPYMDKYLTENCSDDYYLYEPDYRSNNVLECPGCAAVQLTGCLLNTFHEVEKANMASAAVILGILSATLS
jgi:hypothetical protein